jgi:hypothetical protein
MACFSPLVGYYSSQVGKSGKRGITFVRSASFSGVPIKLPCGQCVGCRLERSRQWAMRCMHEKRLHEHNAFVTLTYDNEHLPLGGTLVKRDLQLFMKRLRKERGPGVRFYACGEYGDVNFRPHYHVLLFNCRFPDRLRYSQNRRGEVYYTSQELRSIWFQGHNVIGDVSFDSAAYVARYIMKKALGKVPADHYDVQGAYGEVFRRIPEFTVMSRKPGIGSGWFDKFGAETYALDSCIINGHEVRPPRFYDTRQEGIDPDGMAVLKSVRRKKARLFRADNTVSRLRVREVCALRKLQTLERKV